MVGSGQDGLGSRIWDKGGIRDENIRRLCIGGHGRSHVVARVAGSGPGHPGQNDPLGTPQQHGSSRQFRGSEIRRDSCRQERGQDESAGIPGVPTWQRDADAERCARRHAGNRVGIDGVAGVGRERFRAARPAFHRREFRAGRGARGRTVRKNAARQAA